jgi:parallel beta-helix repeat protein
MIVGIVIILVEAGVVSAFNKNVSLDSEPLNHGDTFYVGGSGPGNYTRIQDAIDNASDGDTVFVYDDSSPYYENIIINKSLNFIGEDRDSTLIDGMASGNSCIEVIANNVHISNFTIQNALYTNNAGIWIRNGSHNVIFNNNIFDSDYGVHIFGKGAHDVTFNNIIKDNYFYNCSEGICVSFSFGDVLSNNKIYNSFYKHTASVGIQDFDSINTIIENNDMRNNGNGIIADGSKNLRILSNNIKENMIGIGLYCSSNVTISKNNIYSNKIFNVYSINYLFPRISFDGNYWGKFKIKSKVILGIQLLYLFTIEREIVSHSIEKIPIYLPLLMVTLDRNPAQEPYPIGV